MELMCVGDIALTVDGLSQRVWTPPAGVIPGDDARILFNWELPIGDTMNPVPRSSGPRLLAALDSPRAIRRWSPGFATLATNHILDAGEPGLSNTIKSLNRSGFATVGAGRTREEITRPLFWATAEGRLAMINWVFPETHPDWMCVPGPNCWPGPEEARHVIQAAKGQADWVLLLLHWSDEHFPYPRPEDRSIARRVAQMGADLVIGHHPHVVRGMEMVDSCLVFYSIGDHYFSDIPDGHGGWKIRAAPRNHEGLGILVSFRHGKGPEYQVRSFWQTGNQAILDPARRAERRMERVSSPLQRFANTGYDHWYTAKRARFDQWGARWHFGARRLGMRGSARHLLRKLQSRLPSRHQP